jgi:hypothetical protein
VFLFLNFFFLIFCRWTSLDYGTYVYRGSTPGSASGIVTVDINPSWKKASFSILGDSFTDTGKNYVHSENFVTWNTFKKSDMTVTLTTKTQLDLQTAFSLDTMVLVNDVDKLAIFQVVDVYKGTEQLNCNASAWYGTESGMIMGLDMHTLWEQSLLFDARYFLNTVVEDIFVPTIYPTSSPSLSPTFSPSSLPSPAPTSIPTLTFYPTAPSFFPSSWPSLSPSSQPSSLPSEIPSSLPTTSPSTTPSHAPSFIPSTNPSCAPSSSAPSISPSSSPTRIPTRSPTPIPPPLTTAVTFSTDVSLDGIDEVMFDSGAQVDDHLSSSPEPLFFC